jgi:hypothetical protein
VKHPALYDNKAAKKAVHLSVNCDLLHQARLLNVNLSQVLEERLVELLQSAHQKIEARRCIMERE